jgi:Flp pilus assembly protein TadD
MTNMEAIAEFKHGVDLLQTGHSADAIQYFRSAVETEKRNPYYLSYLGLAVARAQRKWAAALALCETAMRFKPNEPQFYLNLAEVYVSAGRREEAVEILDSALARFGRNSRIRLERNRLGKRGGQVLPFLPRQNFLNRTLGQLRHQALRRLHRAEEA